MEPVATTEPESDALATIAPTEHLELGVLGVDAPSEAELTGKDKNRAGAKAVMAHQRFEAGRRRAQSPGRPLSQGRPWSHERPFSQGSNPEEEGAITHDLIVAEEEIMEEEDAILEVPLDLPLDLDLTLT